LAKYEVALAWRKGQSQSSSVIGLNFTSTECLVGSL
jgi:hypothetical protein